jgi:fatty acid desaturase
MRPYRFEQGGEHMLWTITIILFVLWALGMVSGATMGWWIHVLLVLAIISLIFAVVRRGPATV